MSIQRMKNQEIEINLKNLVAQERELLREILLHIQQVEVRRIYLDRAYSSTYEYLVKELNYSGSAAMRRIEAARLLKQIPSLSEQIESGSVSLSQVGELSRALKEKERQSGQKVSLLQKKEILASIAGKSVPETQKEIALALDLELKEPEKTRVQKDESVLLSLHLTKEQYELFNRCRDLSAHVRAQKNLDHSWASVLEVLMQSYLKQRGQKGTRGRQETSKPQKPKQLNKDMQKADLSKAEPNQTSSFKVDSSSESIAAAVLRGIVDSGGQSLALQSSIRANQDAVVVNQNPSSSVGNKTLTVKMKKIILTRDQCCQYVDKKSGRKCHSTYQLEVDHKTPRFAGGTNDPQNLQVLCKQHNQNKYHKQTQMRFL